MAMITVTFGNRQYRSALDVKDGNWGDAATRFIQDRYGQDAEICDWEVDGDRTHTAIASVGRES